MALYAVRKKAAVKAAVGEKQFKLWRRSYHVVPPLLDKPDRDPRYVPLGVTEPKGESLEMAYNRLMPYWQDEIAPRLLDGHNQLVVAHGSTLRALIKYIDRINDTDIDHLEVPNGVPIVYEFDAALNVTSKKSIAVTHRIQKQPDYQSLLTGNQAVCN